MSPAYALILAILALLAGCQAEASRANVSNPWGVAAADLNDDGTDDLVIVDAASAQATLYLTVRAAGAAGRGRRAPVRGP